MEGSAHASGALVPRWRGVWRRGGNRTLHRGNGHFNSCSVPSYFFGHGNQKVFCLHFFFFPKSQKVCGRVLACGARCWQVHVRVRVRVRVRVCFRARAGAYPLSLLPLRC